ncbi:hypothetical protein BRD00_00545 [Halobacteriales archaeon QS_8_69_26]|nr:MAG: hypothetical protein BRD00_00545 [Halobacteriales archaeon QS_8_69_26]
MGTVRELAGEAVRNLRYGGPSVVLELLARTYLTYGRRMDGENAYDREWDLLVVLDACRADLMAAAAPDHDWIPEDPETTVALGGTSTEWLDRTFGDLPDDVLAGTAYVTGNPYSDSHIEHDRFGLVDEVWRYAWDDDLGTIPARPITDRTIEACRRGEFDRVVAHYMQPHFPCVPCEDAGGGMDLESFGEEPVSVWEELRFGRRTRADIWADYLANCHYALEEVELLLENVDAAVAVTADHGNAMGEWHLYGHVERVALPALREVPWVEAAATDRGTHDPAEYDRGRADDEVTDRLEALGYR